MEIVDNLETAAGTVLGAIEHPFHTIGARLKAAGEHIAAFLSHPYAAPPLQDALTTLHGIVVDLAQEIAELRVPCPCKPASTSAIAGDAGQAAASGGTAGSGDAVPGLSDADMADFRAWQKAKADAASFTGQA